MNLLNYIQGPFALIFISLGFNALAIHYLYTVYVMFVVICVGYDDIGY